MSAVETLREAAKVLRERAEVETILRDGDPYYEVTYMPDGTPVTEMGAFERVVTPGVALALADWLDHEARMADWEYETPPEALRVAEAILGGTS